MSKGIKAVSGKENEVMKCPSLKINIYTKIVIS